MKYGTFLIILAPVLSTMAWAQEAQKPKETLATGQKAAAATDPTPLAAPIAVPADYKIGPQDVLRVDVWKEPQITRDVPVRPDGKISIPLLNDVQAAGLTPTELSAAIRQGLQKYITEPEVTVTVTQINSRRVFVTGEVAHPGAFPLLPDMTVLQVLSSCGGFTQFANTKKIFVLRTEAGKQVKISVNYKNLISGNKPEENILLQPGDTIVVP